MTPGVNLRELSTDEYARDILPLTYELWGRGRSFESYVARTRTLASTPYAKHSYGTFALSDTASRPLATFKRYGRTARVDGIPVRAIGIGAVFTAPEHRGHGYASAMLGMALDREREGGGDIAFLFSDIHPQFYKNLGFFELPSRTFSVRVDRLPWQRLNVESPDVQSWNSIRSCFEATMSRADLRFERPASFWNWLRTMREGQEPKAQRVDLVVRRSRRIAAYVLGAREPRADAYVLDEFGYVDDEAGELIPPLLRYAAGDLRRVAGWLPPLPARCALHRGSVRARADSILMAAPLSKAGSRFIERALACGSGDPVWSTDHI